MGWDRMEQDDDRDKQDEIVIREQIKKGRIGQNRMKTEIRGMILVFESK
jgi:hypothetical protein